MKSSQNSLFDDWTDRYQHHRSGSTTAADQASNGRMRTHILKGCQSVVYFGAETDEVGCIHFSASSDAAIVQGLIALLFRVYSGRQSEEILATGPEFLTEIGLDKHLLPNS